MNGKKGIFIIGLLIVILLGLLVYYKLSESHSGKMLIDIVHKISVPESEIDELERYIVPFNDTFKTSSNSTKDGMYRSSRVNVSNLSNNIKMYLIIKNILANEKLDKKYITTYECEEGICEQDITEEVCSLENGCQVLFTISEVLVDQYASKYFGLKPYIKHEGFEDKSLGIKCEFDKEYKCRQKYYGYSVNYQNYTKRVKYQVYDNEIVIYHHYLLHNGEYYTSFDSTRNVGLNTDVVTDAILGNYGRVYKSVFRKEDGEYVWAYSEPVK